LRPYVQAADAYVFSRAAYCWEVLDRQRMAVTPPCIDAFAPKNQPMAPPTVSAILQAAGILDAHEGISQRRCSATWTAARAESWAGPR
jgi:trehalose synthase